MKQSDNEKLLEDVVTKHYGVQDISEVKVMFEAGEIPLDELFKLVSQAQSKIKMQQVKSKLTNKGDIKND